MKRQLIVLLIALSQVSFAQIGIGSNATPGASSILDLSSDSKGLLVPRLTKLERNAIAAPELGLLIFNTDDSDFNSYNGSVLGWQDFSTGYKTVSLSGTISTTSTIDVVATGMTATPSAGTYSVKFNSQYKNAPTYTIVPSSVDSFLLDLNTLIGDLDKYFIIGTPEYNSIGHTHYASYNNNIGVGSPLSNDLQANYVALNMTLYPGAYYEGAAINFVKDAVITFDGLGDSEAKFIFKANAAINTGIGVKFILINGARANNIYWLANGAMSIGATNEMKGNCVSRAGAMAVGIATNLEGRILTSAGALTMGSGTLEIPLGETFINLRSLTSFVGWTSAGDVNITGALIPVHTFITGNVFTCDAFNNFGFTPPYGTGNPATNTQPIIGSPVSLTGKLYRCTGPLVSAGAGVESTVDSESSFSLYKNGTEIPGTAKVLRSNSISATITLETLATFNGTDVIEVRWKTPSGISVSMGNRDLTLIKVK
jgi:hypothetical protein